MTAITLHDPLTNVEFAYLLRRIDQERTCAAFAAHPAARQAHNDLAAAYERRLRRLTPARRLAVDDIHIAPPRDEPDLVKRLDGGSLVY